MSDPNGWVTQPPATMVKVVNTSREALNGKLGIVLAYQNDRGRYVVLMTTSQEQVSLKADNLRKGSWMEQLRAQYELLQNNPQVQQQVRQIYRQVQRFTGVTPEYVAAAAGLVLLAAIYFLGLSRVILILSFLMLGAMVVQPDLAAGATPRQMMRNAPRRFRDLVRQHVPVVGHRIANSDILTGLAAGLMLFFFVNALVGRTGTGTTGGGDKPSSPVSPTARRVTADRDLLQEYYKLGFDDATAGNEFGISLPAATAETSPPLGVHDSWPGYNDPVPPSSPSLLSKFTNWSTLVSLYVVGSTVYNAGRTIDGNGFDVQLAVANLRMLDAWKQGMLALSVYRLVSAVLT